MSESSGQSSQEQRGAIRNVLSKILKRPREKEPVAPISIQVFDESDPGNVISDRYRNFGLPSQFGIAPYSTEGFAEDLAKQTELARFFIYKLGLKNRGPLLDVGFGANIHIANTFISEGMEAYAIDAQQHDHTDKESIWHAPRLVRTNGEGVNILSGDIADISSKESVLRSEQFGLVLFNGSWTAGGNNWTVAGEVMEGKYHNKSSKTESLIKFMDREKDKILRSCKEQLTVNGLIGVVSSRYAFHGAGYSYSQLPEEKLSFIDVFDRLQRLGAKRIYLFGITQRSFDEMLVRSSKAYPPEDDKDKLPQETVESVREQLKTVFNLSREDIYLRYRIKSESKYQKARIDSIVEATKNTPELNNLARIDAIFAEF